MPRAPVGKANSRMRRKYQIAILGPRAGRYGGILKRSIRKRLRDLGGPLIDFIDFLTPPKVLTRDIKSPIVGVYFGGTRPRKADLDAVRALMTTASVLLPAVEQLNRVTSLIPAELHRINGIEIDPTDQPRRFDQFSS